MSISDYSAYFVSTIIQIRGILCPLHRAKIGKKSFDVIHEAYQNQLLVAKGNAVLVWYNYAQQSSSLIPEEIRKLLKQHQL